MIPEITLASLTDHIPRTADGRSISLAHRLGQLVELGVTAERLGFDGFALGEHHSRDFAVSSPAVVLAAIAARTERIRLGTAVTVLSALDPVRLYEDFATLDQISKGRAEVTVGRGAFVEPFALFGVPIERYDDVFAEKLDLLIRIAQLGDDERISWSGRFRTALREAEIWPRTLQPHLPIWVGVGGSPESAERAGRLGLPMTIGSIGMSFAQLRSLADAYRRAGDRAGHPELLRLGVGAHVLATPSSAEARDAYPYYRDFLAPRRPGGNGLSVSPAQFEQGFHPDVVRLIGTAEEVGEKLVRLHRAVRFDRLQLLPDWGGLPEPVIDASLRLLAGDILPVLRDDVARR